MYRKHLKRFFDIFLAFIAIVLLSPIILVTGVLVIIKLGKPILFQQERPGLNGRIFIMYKFRTMKDLKDENGQFLPDEIRLTEFGKKLRATSLDELPELINIIKGDMSIVGPRPLLIEYLSRYNEEQKHRHDVRPGLTGLAQVNGRNLISWEEKFQLDVTYTRHITFLGDLKIIFATIGKVIFMHGINSETSATIEKFK